MGWPSDLPFGSCNMAIRRLPFISIYCWFPELKNGDLLYSYVNVYQRVPWWITPIWSNDIQCPPRCGFAQLRYHFPAGMVIQVEDLLFLARLSETCLDKKILINLVHFQGIFRGDAGWLESKHSLFLGACLFISPLFWTPRSHLLYFNIQKRPQTIDCTWYDLSDLCHYFGLGR